jgi:dTDP-4-amino-4,6-dideoxygalactose transaminase
MPKLAIMGGEPVRKKGFDPWPVYTDAERAALEDVLTSRNWGGQPIPGKHGDAFGRKFAAFHTAKYGQCVNTGTVAIQAALTAVGIQPGDEVLVPAYTWVGTVGPVLLVNAVPVFIDVDPDTYCMDARLIEQAITPKTRVILPVHLGMRFADLDAIIPIAQKHNLRVVEDCAHVHGGMWCGKGAGSIGDLGTFSFQSSKLITCGQGGAVITNNLEFFERVQVYINTGRGTATHQFGHGIIGFNYQMSEFQASVLGPQLERLPEQLRIRQANFDYFHSRLQGTLGLRFLKPEPRITRTAAYCYVLKYCAEQAKDIPRAAFVAALRREGVPCEGLVYEPVYKSSLFPVKAINFPALSWGRSEPLDLRNMYRCPVAEHAAYHEAVWFPHYLFLGSRDDIDTIVEAIFKTLENVEELRQFEHQGMRHQGLT